MINIEIDFNDAQYTFTVMSVVQSGIVINSISVTKTIII